MNVHDRLKKAEKDIKELNHRLIALTAAGGYHNLLSSIHQDTIGANPVAGDLIYAAGSPVRWQRRAVGNPNDYLQVLAGAPTWAPLVGVVSEDDIAFKDTFNDASIYWAWDVQNDMPPGRYVTEAGGVLTIGGQAAVAAVYSTSGMTAPRIRLGAPGYPYKFWAKLSGWSGNNETQAAIWQTWYDSATSSWLYGPVRIDSAAQLGLAVYQCNAADPGTQRSYMAWSTYPVWLRCRWNSPIYTGLIQLFFDYSTDGLSWTQQYQTTVNYPHSTSQGDAVGLLSRNWNATRNAHWVEFDEFRAIRDFGPG